MKKRLLAITIGILAGMAVLGGYVVMLNAGVHVRPELLVGGTAALAFAAAVAVFSLLAMDRPAFRNTSPAILLNADDPANEFIFWFAGSKTVAITARPDMSVGEMLVRHDDTFKSAPDKLTKSVVVTLRGSAKKPFAAFTLQQLFATLKPYGLQHVLLLGEKDEFIGYIPGKRALAEFAGDKAEEKIGKYLVKVFANPGECAVLREIGGVTRDDTVSESETALHAEAKIWANDNVHGLVIHRHLKPVGYISKVDVLRLNAVRT